MAFSSEGVLRKRFAKKFLEQDLIEAIIGLPPKLSTVVASL
jgi:hypothetical protein